MHVPSPTKYLDAENIDYTLVPHITSFTAQETAQKTHIKGNELSKVVVISDHKKLMMVVIPASCILLQRSIAKLLNSSSLSIVPEHQFKDSFPGCEIGAMPPFGNLYGMDVLVAKELSEQKYITFNGGAHNLLIRMRTSDFLNMTDAQIIKEGYKVAGLSHPIISHRKDDWRWL